MYLKKSNNYEIIRLIFAIEKKINSVLILCSYVFDNIFKKVSANFIV